MSRDRQEEDAVSEIRFINPDALQKPPGYTHVVEATTPGRLVYIAGQLGGRPRRQARQQRLPRRRRCRPSRT